MPRSREAGRSSKRVWLGSHSHRPHASPALPSPAASTGCLAATQSCAALCLLCCSPSWTAPPTLGAAPTARCRPAPWPTSRRRRARRSASSPTRCQACPGVQRWPGRWAGERNACNNNVRRSVRCANLPAPLGGMQPPLGAAAPWQGRRLACVLAYAPCRGTRALCRSWMREYNPWLEAKPDAEEQRRNNKRLVQKANEDGIRWACRGAQWAVLMAVLPRAGCSAGHSVACCSSPQLGARSSSGRPVEAAGRAPKESSHTS